MLAAAAPRVERRTWHWAPFVLGATGVLAGLVLRLSPLVQADFPLNDGGLFSAMIDAVRSSHYALPFSIAYNGMTIPFGYPPLGFYLAAGIANIARVSTVEVLRVLPFLLCLVFCWAYFRLTRTVLRTPLGVSFALSAFLVFPGSYQWLVGGGGLTRALGLTFAVLGLREVYLLSTTHSSRPAVRLAIFATLAITSHLEMAWLLAYSGLLVFLTYGRSWDNAARGVASAAAALILSAPWWLSVLLRHGLAPFQAAGSTGSILVSSQEDPSLTVLILGLLVLCAILAATGDERLFLTAWFGVIFLLGTRSVWLITIPLPLAIGRSGEHVAAFLARLGESPAPPSASTLPSARGVASTLLMLLVVTPMSLSTTAHLMATRDALTALSSGDQAALRWVAAETPQESRFVVVSGGLWSRDRVGEWMPYLTHRVAASTAQGTEWLPGGEFGRRIDIRERLQRCGSSDEPCLAAWRMETGVDFTHVYVTHWADDCCAPLRDALRTDPGYRLVYDGPSASIFERVT